MAENHDETGSDAVQGASTLLEVLNTLRDRGYDEQLIAQDDGTVRCAGCEARTPAGDLDVTGFHRLEGASDPADMNMVIWAQCPACDTKGVATVGFGPNASTADTKALEHLDLDHVESADEGNADA